MEVKFAVQRESESAVKFEVFKSAADCLVDLRESVVTVFVEFGCVESDSFEVDCDCRVENDVGSVVALCRIHSLFDFTCRCFCKVEVGDGDCYDGIYVFAFCIFTFECGKTCSDGERVDCVVLGGEFKEEFQTVNQVGETFGKSAAEHIEQTENFGVELSRISGDAVLGCRTGRVIDEEACDGVVRQDVLDVEVVLCVKRFVNAETEHFKHAADGIFETVNVDVEDSHNVADKSVKIPVLTHICGESRDNFRNRFACNRLIVVDEVVETLVVGVVEITERNLNVLTCIVDVDVVYVVEEVVCGEPVFLRARVVDLCFDCCVGALVLAAGSVENEVEQNAYVYAVLNAAVHAVDKVKFYGKTKAHFEIVGCGDCFVADSGGFFPKRVKIVLHVRGIFCRGRRGGRGRRRLIIILIAARYEREHQNQRKNHDEK